MRLLMILLCCLPVGGHSFHRNNLAVGFGGAFPVGANYSGWRNRPELSLGYGLRLHRHFQADVGVETVFRPTGVILGRIDIDTKDTLFLIPVGGRVIATPKGERLWLSAGAGATYYRYRTEEDLGFGHVAFGKWGYYALAGASLALDRGHHFRVGATPKFHGVNGRSRASRLFSLAGEFTFSF